jgi:hypothetical protein
MALREPSERWETEVSNCEATSLSERDGPNAPTAVHDQLGITFYPKEKGNAIADSLTRSFTSYDMFDTSSEPRVDSRVQVLLAYIDDILLGKVRPCKFIN